MLWFNINFIRLFRQIKTISIHLMLWFNFYGRIGIGSTGRISIHLMLWFNKIIFLINHQTSSFQYILCYGSTKKWQRKYFFYNDFNTSYVMVQQKAFKKQCKNLISIHLMLWFNVFFGQDS